MEKMKNPYKKYKMKLTVLTPLFIGSGVELNKGMYIYENDTVRIVDELKLANFLAENNLTDKFASLLLKGDREASLKDWLFANGFKNLNLPIYDYSIPVKNLLSKKKNFKTGKMEIKESKNLNTIKTFIKNADGLPYIPGSSIKGAIRTAFLSYMLYKNKPYFIQKDYWNKVRSALMNKQTSELNKLEKQIEAECFMKIEYENGEKGDRFKGLQISDTNPISSKKLYISQRLDLAIQNKDVSPMPMYLEFLEPGTELSFTMTVDTSLAPIFTDKTILNRLDFYTNKQIDLMSVFYDKFSEDVVSDEWSNEDNNPNICIGGSTGYFSKNIVYSLAPTHEEAVDALRMYFAKCFDRMKHKHSEYDEEISPHTLKLTKTNTGNVPLGWCNINFEEDITKDKEFI